MDFHINNKIRHDGSPDPRYYSYKYKAAGLRYLVAVSICSSDIVYLAGPYLPGMYNDLMIFRMCGIKDELEQREKVEADDGYSGDHPGYCICPKGYATRTDQKKLTGRVRMRHEHINERMKNFQCLSLRFRHSVEQHSACFRAVAVLTQLAIESGKPMIDMREYDDRLSDDQIRQQFAV